MGFADDADDADCSAGSEASYRNEPGIFLGPPLRMPIFASGAAVPRKKNKGLRGFEWVESGRMALTGKRFPEESGRLIYGKRGVKFVHAFPTTPSPGTA